MKKLSLLFLTVMLGMGAFAQTTYYWRAEATNGNWNDANNWWTNTTAVPTGGEILSFGNDNQLTMTNNLAATNRHQIIFTNSATQSRIITGTTENTFYKVGGNKPKIENNSSANQTIDFPLKWEYITNSAMELKPVLGDLTITKAINNNGLWTDVLGGSGKTLSIASMSGTGGLSIKNNPTTVKITGTSTYTGITHVNFGTLELQADLSSAEIIVYSGAKLIINGNDVDVQKLTINSGGTVEVLPGKQLTIKGTAVNNGTIKLLSNGTDGTATVLGNVSGNAEVEQNLSAVRNWYMSSPVAAGKMPATGHQYNETVSADNWEPVSANADMTVGRGYIVIPGSTGNVSFSGALNNGNQSIALTRSNTNTSYKGFNLVGNPYPSFLNSATLLAENNTKVEGNIWYRTANWDSGQNKHIYQFQTYNSISDVSVPKASNGSYIPPMQAFWVRALSSLNTLPLGDRKLDFTNAMRRHNDSTVVIRLRAPKAPTADRQYVRLQVSNAGLNDELLLYSDANASNAYDKYDAPKMMNTSNSSAAINLYTTVGSENLVIDGRNSLPLDVVIPVTFSTNAYASGSYSILANEISNLPSGVTVKVVDNSVETSLSDGGTYTFTADAGTTKTFGLILRSPGTVTGVENGNADKFHVYANSNRQIVVNAPATTLVNVYNSIGQRITIQNMNSTWLQINVPTAGVYLVNVGGNVYKVVAP